MKCTRVRFLVTAVILLYAPFLRADIVYRGTDNYANRPAPADTIKGRVTDPSGLALPGIMIMPKGSSVPAVITDASGRYAIQALSSDTLIYTGKGFLTRRIGFKDALDTDIVLQAADHSVSRYNTLFAPQRKTTAVASIAEVYYSNIRQIQSPSVGGMLAGKLAGLTAGQVSGEPGNDTYNLLLRGQSPFILVDGTPQSITSINPEQIESITILKDALSTAMLGIRGAGGAVLITTKKGTNDESSITFNTVTGFQTPTKKLKVLHSPEYATLYNEALVNDGRQPFYSQADIDAYRAGTDLAGHPDVDWADELLRERSYYGRYDLAMSGGGNVARYFVNLDFLDQQGLFKTQDFNVYNTNSTYKRYIFRSNADVDLNRSINVSLNLLGRIQNFNQPGSSTANIFTGLINTPNNAYPIFNSDKSLAGTSAYQQNLYGLAFNSGYRSGYGRDLKVDLAITGDLGDLTPGLWIKGLVSVHSMLQESINRSKPVVTFRETSATGGSSSYQKFGNTGDQSNSINVEDQFRLFYSEISMGYSRDAGRSGIDALLVASNDNRTLNSDLPQNIRGISGRLTYDLDKKYIAEFAFGYNGSERYPANKRYGFFPAAGIAWNLGEEIFIRNNTPWISRLKLRTTYGLAGNNNAGYYVYNQYFSETGDYNFGNTPTAANGVQAGAMSNPYITWEKALKFNAGADASFFSGRLDLTVEYFNNKYYDLLQQPGRNSALLGTGFPLTNLGSNRYSGMEFQAGLNHSKGSFTFSIAPNITFLQTKVLDNDEVSQPYEWMRQTGKPDGQLFGYLADGLFQNQQEVNASAKPAGTGIAPGDIKYRDLNKDGLIDQYDQAAIGSTRPRVFYGVYLGAGWKGVDFSAQFQGAANRQVYLEGNAYRAFRNNGFGQAYAHHLDRWTPETATTASYPRLSTGPETNNSEISSYWLRSGNFLRARHLEIGYTLPSSTATMIRVKGLRIFLNGTNLFTFSALKELDPENYAGLYPIQKVLTAGLSVKF